MTKYRIRLNGANTNQLKSFFILFFCITFYSIAFAQTGGVRGITLSDKGEPLPFVGVYAKNLNSGTSSNLDAKFEMKLSPGEYKLLIQCLGYKTEERTVTVANDWIDLNIILVPTTYLLGEVKIGAKDEDPAYAIMRKAISMAKFYKYQVQEYSAKAYLKGVGKLKTIPWVIRKMAKQDLKESGIDTGKLYLTEQVSELFFKQPNERREKVISVNSNQPENFPSPMDYIKGSFYEPTIAGCITPLSPRAFAYYTFKLEGSYYEGANQINKIKVTPRSKGDGLFRGTIYIVENQWCLQSINLAVVKEGITAVVTQLYTEVQNKVWMPLTQSYVIYGSIYGFVFEGKYQATTNNYKIKLNENLHAPVEIIDEKTEKEKLPEATKVKSNDEQSLETLLQGDKKFTRKDMKKLMKMYEKEESKKAAEPEVLLNRTVEIDSMAYKRDSTYWLRERTISLTEKEAKSYKVKDSLVIIDKKLKEDSSKTKKSKFSLSTAYTLGHQFKLDSSTTLIVRFAINYNTVEGYVPSPSLTYNKKFKNKNRFSITPTGRYSFDRNIFSGKGIVTYQYGKEKILGRISAEGGKYISQFNPNNPISYGLNTLSTLFFESNFMKMYEKEYYGLTFFQNITNNLSFTLNGEFANRFILSNSSNAKPIFDWKENSFTPNTPINREVASTNFSPNKAFTTQVSLKYYLWKKYIIENGVKSEIGSAPEINLNYRKGWADVLNSNVDFDLIELGAKYSFKLGVRGTLSTEVNAGTFINNNKMYFMDFRHFMGKLTFIQQTVTGYRLLDYYQYSTSQYFAEGFLNFQTRKLLLTQFAVPRMMGLKENIILNYLYTPVSNNYMEVGYGVDKIFRFLRVEVVSSFNNFQYQSIGFRIGIAVGLF